MFGISENLKFGFCLYLYWKFVVSYLEVGCFPRMGLRGTVTNNALNCSALHVVA